MDRKFIVCLLLVLAILAIYGKVRHYEFINFDDDIYVTANSFVVQGVNPEGLRWSFNYTLKDGNYWQPLTWLSHMLDVTLYGMDAGRHHLSNVFFHIASTVLLFLAFNRMTGALWRSAFVAALFALHPINVESVAWVAGRKNVLSTFFWMLTLLFYAGYHQRHGVLRYLAVIFAFGLGLLAKPMLVTLPFVLLLLDYWPLKRIVFKRAGRFPAVGVLRLILEKLPLFILSALSVYLSAASVKGMGNVISLENMPMKLRFANALVAYVKYIGKLIWPYHLAVYYPLPERIPIWQPLTAFAMMFFISILVFRTLNRKPYLAVGWLWYLGTLIPVIGLVQVGMWPAMADRWAYVPTIGLFIILAWGFSEIACRWRYQRIVLAGLSVSALTALLILSYLQISHWRNSVSLFEHGIKVTGGTWKVHNNLANALNARGRSSEAIGHYKHALELDPPEPEGVHYNLAIALTSMGRLQEAIEQYYEAIHINPDYADAHVNLGAALARLGKTAEASRHYFAALRVDPNFAQANYNLGNLLLAQGETDAAISRYSKAVHINPLFAEAYNGLGLAFMQTGKLEQAVFCFREAAKLNPAFSDGLRNLKLAESISKKIFQAVSGMRDALNFNMQTQDLDHKVNDLLEKKQKLEKTLKHFQKTLSRQPGFAEFDQNNIAVVLAVKRKYEQKLDLFRRISEVKPDSAEADYHIACIYSRKGQIRKSISLLNQVIAKGFDRWELIETDSDLDLIRDDDNFPRRVEG
ncbi:MAG: tetratricopeptide repeat protein [Desulfobacterales bacterium]|jgi:tetratricopeptide (TPR) repeat protein